MSTALRTYFRGHTLAAVREQPVGGSAATRYYHFDHQGTTQCLTDATGAVTDRFASDAWGVQVKRTGTSINRDWYVGNWGYHTQPDNGLNYVRARYFASRLGAWLSQDPIATAQRLYVYAHCRPSVLKDVTGLRVTKQQGCTPGEVDQYNKLLNDACGLFKQIRDQITAPERPSWLQKINRCIKESGERCAGDKLQIRPGDVPPGKQIREEATLQCLIDACSNLWLVCSNVQCPRGFEVCCKGETPPCACANRISNFPAAGKSQCKMERCIGNECQDDFGLGEIGTVIHELSHCCGYPPDKGRGYPSCSDIVACCITRVMNDQGWDICKVAPE
jgi:RHS repeat-associated protein